MRILHQLVLAAFISLVLSGCSNAAEKNKIKPTATPKGAQQGMKTYYMGRFAIDVPAEFKLAVQSQKFRYIEITEFDWPQNTPRETARKQIWGTKIEEISKLKSPRGINKVLIKSKDINNVGKWCKGVLYYGNNISNKKGQWDVLIDFGAVGLWLKLSGLVEYEQEMLTDILEMAASYDFLGSDNHKTLTTSKGFYSQKGVFTLPYLEQEKTYARFEGHPLGLKLEIQMSETHKVEEAGVMDRLAASMAANFAPGVDVDKIRTGKRTLTGLVGQEIVTRMSDKNSTELFFAWDYQGKENSGEHPEIKIGLECPDGNLEEKLKIWDKTLDSFRPAYK
ncbi:T6SS immunity protein Tli4 family protein [Pelotalea chapellei]|uniref:Tle cognate immunity protein 4 C-terminal domain-containing protein n=1 Tax=Pelotalea chapellei TaxID=44671 RepID=A0ABS5UAQ5_9BACT|nr:T6SS immunity protein Tli4 family protein [Pelotalea chapellei]MBT1072761.1 hypothetical protein [Pelotalea chapellei]